MSLAIYFAVDGPPVGKGRPRASTKGGFVRMYTDAKTLSYEAQIADAASKAMGNNEPLATPIDLRVWVWYRIPKSWPKRTQQEALDGERLPNVKPDLDNVLKAVLDAMNDVVYVDDSQVVNMVAHKRYGAQPRIEVYVNEYLK